MFANYYHSFNKLGAFQRDDLVDALVVVEQVVNAEFLHGQSQVDHRATNASAESLNSKIKQFRAQLRGVIDVDFFLYRLSMIYG